MRLLLSLEVPSFSIWKKGSLEFTREKKIKLLFDEKDLAGRQLVRLVVEEEKKKKKQSVPCLLRCSGVHTPQGQTEAELKRLNPIDQHFLTHRLTHTFSLSSPFLSLFLFRFLSLSLTSTFSLHLKDKKSSLFSVISSLSRHPSSSCFVPPHPFFSSTLATSYRRVNLLFDACRTASRKEEKAKPPRPSFFSSLGICSLFLFFSFFLSSFVSLSLPFSLQGRGSRVTTSHPSFTHDLLIAVLPPLHFVLEEHSGAAKRESIFAYVSSVSSTQERKTNRRKSKSHTPSTSRTLAGSED